MGLSGLMGKQLEGGTMSIYAAICCECGHSEIFDGGGSEDDAQESADTSNLEGCDGCGAKSSTEVQDDTGG